MICFLISFETEIGFAKAILDDMFTEEIDSISNDLEGIVHQVAKSILEVPFSPAKDELNRKGPFLCTQ